MRPPKKDEGGNNIAKMMEIITQTNQKTDMNTKPVAALERIVAQLAEQIGKRGEGKFPLGSPVSAPSNVHVEEDDSGVELVSDERIESEKQLNL
ncbi:hypothetical protein L1887_32780 [Cichorium endivia]|nr:hypothetical protein L1887_32780 [Cichorium endivia]